MKYKYTVDVTSDFKSGYRKIVKQGKNIIFIVIYSN